MLVESIVALCLHVASESFEKRPSSYRETLRFIAERLNVKCISDLELLVGLRNLLIHQYWNIDDRKIYQDIKTSFKCIKEFLSKIEEFLK